MNVKHHDYQQERASKWGISFLINVMKLTGPGFVKLLVVPVAFYYFLFSPNARKFSGEYLLRMRGDVKLKGVSIDLLEKSLLWLTFRHILSFSHSIVDRVHAWSTGSGTTHYQVEGQELLDDVLNNKHRGALFLISHLGNFDLAIARSEIAPDSRFNIILDTAQARKYNKFRDKIFQSKQVRFIIPEALTPLKIISLTRQVINGEVIVIAADRAINPNNKNSVQVDFLGGQATFPSGPYIMAHLLEVPVYCLFAVKKRDCCLIRFEVFEPKVIIPRKQRQLAIKQYAQKFATRLEQECLASPLQWYNFYDFWACPEPQVKSGDDGTS